jgi:hypothetical protein
LVLKLIEGKGGGAAANSICLVALQADGKKNHHVFFKLKEDLASLPLL